MTLAANVGKMLTLELAQAMAREICVTPDKSFKPQDFPPVEHKGYVLALEQFRDILPELHILHQRHYAEVDTSGIPLNGDHDAGKLSEHNGGLMQFTARVKATGELVGNLRFFIFSSHYTQTLIGNQDTLYILPEHRGSFMAVHLWRFAEVAMAKAGVLEIIFMIPKTQSSAMARRLKYTPSATKFSKFLTRK